MIRDRLNAPTGKQVFYNLEAIRGICALCVALLHVPWINVTLYVSPVLQGWAMVDFFFVLSGFVVSYNYIDRITGLVDVRSFMTRRIFRLVPLYAFTLLVCLLIDLLRDFALPMLSGRFAPRIAQASGYWWDVGWSVLLLQGMGVTAQSRPNPPSWSISTEMFAYVTFALVCLAAPRRVRVWIIGGMGVGAFLAQQHLQGWTGINGPMEFRFFRCLYSFSLGVVVAECYMADRIIVPQRWIGTLQAVLWAAVIGLLYLIDRFDFRSSVLPLMFAALVALCVTDSGSLWKSVLEFPILKRLGELSYSIYMVHAFLAASISFVVNRFSTSTGTIFDIVRPQLPYGLGEVSAILYVCVVLVVSNLTYERIEKPWRERGRRLGGAQYPTVARVTA